MGISQSCSLDRLSNLCQMHKCVTGVNGRASDSASATDTWVCELKPDTTYRGRAISKTFMKIGINPASMPKPKKAKAGESSREATSEATSEATTAALDRIEAATGLMYEFQVYHNIVTPILDANICPNFLRSYLVSYNCQYDDLLETLKIGLVKHKIPPASVDKHLNRNISYMYDGKDNRPAIQSTKGLVAAYPLPSLRYMVLTTEFTNVTDYWVWLGEGHSLESRRIVLLQIAIALYVMSKSKLMHNDLRAPNIFVQTLPKPEYWTYAINDYESISLYTIYLVELYDYDRGTAESLGDNAYVKDSGIYDADLPLFEENRDLVCLYKSLTDKKLRDSSLISKFFDVSRVNLAGEWYKGRGVEIPTSLIEGIFAIAKTLPKVKHAGQVYRITDDMFMRDGTLNRDHENLSTLRVQNKKHELSIAEYKATLEGCNAYRRKLEMEIEDLKKRLPKEEEVFALEGLEKLD